MKTTTTTYGNTIHADDTIARTRTYFFSPMLKTLQDFWANRKSTPNTEGGSWTANIKELTISVTDYITSEEYFAHIEGDEEE